MRFNGQVAPETHDAKLETILRDRLDALIVREKEYDPRAPAEGGLRLRSPYGFQKEVEGSLTIHARRKMCPALEHDIGTPLDERRRMLFILGTQKGGTTFLFNALNKHRGFVGADHAYGCVPLPCGTPPSILLRGPLDPSRSKSVSCGLLVADLCVVRATAFEHVRRTFYDMARNGTLIFTSQMCTCKGNILHA